MIVYGTFTETSVAKLFMAGVVPGLLLTVMFMGFVGVYAWFRPAGAPAERGAATHHSVPPVDAVAVAAALPAAGLALWLPAKMTAMS